MKIWLRPKCGMHINAAALEALKLGCTHMRFNDRIYRVTVQTEEVTGAVPKLDGYFNTAPYGVDFVEFQL